MGIFAEICTKKIIQWYGDKNRNIWLVKIDKYYEKYYHINHKKADKGIFYSRLL